MSRSGRWPACGCHWHCTQRALTLISIADRATGLSNPHHFLNPRCGGGVRSGGPADGGHGGCNRQCQGPQRLGRHQLQQRPAAIPCRFTVATGGRGGAHTRPRAAPPTVACGDQGERMHAAARWPATRACCRAAPDSKFRLLRKHIDYATLSSTACMANAAGGGHGQFRGKKCTVRYVMCDAVATLSEHRSSSTTFLCCSGHP